MNGWDVLFNSVNIASRLPLERWLFNRHPEQDLEELRQSVQAAPSPPSNPRNNPSPLTQEAPPEAATEQLTAEGKACLPCIPDGTLVWTNPHVKPIQHVSVGDKVVDLEGQYSIVTEVMGRHYDGELVAIEIPYQNELILLTPEHPVLAIEAHSCRAMPARGSICFPGKDNPRCQQCNLRRKYKPRWVAAERLSADGIKAHWVKHILLMPRLTNTIDVQRVHVGRVAGIEYEDIDEGFIKPKREHAHNKSRTAIAVRKMVSVSDLMELAGLYIAEGSVTSQRRGAQLRFDFGKDEPNLARRTAELVRQIFGCEAAIKESQTTLRVTVLSSLVAYFFANLFGKGALHKQIPEWVLMLPKVNQTDLLKGYWDGDGAKHRKHEESNSTTFSAATVSRSLAYSLRIMLHRLGLIHALRRHQVSSSIIDGRIIKSNGWRYHLQVGGPSAIRLASMLKQQAYPWRFLQSHLAGIDERWVYLPVKKVERVKYSGIVRNLRTEPTNTYTAFGVVVHNCGSDHLSTVASLLSEAIRFSRKGGVEHPEVVDRIATALDELNVFEREDGAPEKVARLKGEEKALMDEMLEASRDLRHIISAITSVELLEQAAARARERRLDFHRRLFRLRMRRLSPERKRRVQERAQEILANQVKKEIEVGYAG